MSFKKFSIAQDAPAKDGSADKAKQAAPAEKPAATPGQKPGNVAPSTKA